MRLPDIDVHLCRTAEDVAAFMSWIDQQLQAGETIAIDTETTGLRWWDYRFTRLVQFGVKMSGWAIPVDWWGKVIEAGMQKIVDADASIVMHNAGFDMHALRVEGYPLPRWGRVHDTALLLRLRRSNLPAGLKSSHTRDLVGPWVFAGKTELAEARKRHGLSTTDVWQFMPVDDPAYWGYGVLDTCLTRWVLDHEEIQPLLTDPAYLRESRYQAVMHRAEIRGLRVDEKYTTALDTKWAARLEELDLQLRGTGLANPRSRQQVIALLEEEYGWVPEEFTASGQAALDKNVMAALSVVGGDQAELIQALVEYHRITKWRSTYTRTMLEGADRHGFVHPSIMTMGARTGRTSIQKPALQTLPSGDPVIRRCLLAPKGHSWYSIDYSNQEPRLLAHFGQSPELLAFFREGDGTGSIHDLVSAELFGSSYTKAQRAVAKAFGLGRSYGAGVSTLARASGFPEHEVEALLPKYDELTGLASLNAAIERIAVDRAPEPYILTSGGRRVYADEGKEYTLVNYLMQGSGADMLKDAVLRLDDEGLADYIQVPVHDEVCFAFPKDEAPAYADRAAELLRDDSFSVPMPVDIEGPAKSWGHIYDGDMA